MSAGPNPSNTFAIHLPYICHTFATLLNKRVPIGGHSQALADIHKIKDYIL